MVGPSLIESLKRLSKTEFHDKLMKGNAEKGMPPFSGSEMVVKNWEGLYAYLKGRSEGEPESRQKDQDALCDGQGKGALAPKEETCGSNGRNGRRAERDGPEEGGPHLHPNGRTGP